MQFWITFFEHTVYTLKFLKPTTRSYWNTVILAIVNHQYISYVHQIVDVFLITKVAE